MIKDQQFPEPSLTKTELNQLLGGWEGYELGTVGRVKESEEGAEVVWIELLPRADRLKCAVAAGSLPMRSMIVKSAGFRNCLFLTLLWSCWCIAAG
jgi:hypothetical protein